MSNISPVLDLTFFFSRCYFPCLFVTFLSNPILFASWRSNNPCILFIMWAFWKALLCALGRSWNWVCICCQRQNLIKDSKKKNLTLAITESSQIGQISEPDFSWQWHGLFNRSGSCFKYSRHLQEENISALCNLNKLEVHWVLQCLCRHDVAYRT